MFKRVQKRGIISAKSDNSIKITLDKANPIKCEAKGCHLCSTGDVPAVEITVNREFSDLRVGEQVLISTIKIPELLATFMLLGVPIILSVAFYTLAITVLNWDAESGKAIAGTLLTLILSIVSYGFVEKIIQYFYPVEIEKFEGC